MCWTRWKNYSLKFAEKNTGKIWKKTLEKSGNFVRPKKWEAWWMREECIVEIDLIKTSSRTHCSSAAVYNNLTSLPGFTTHLLPRENSPGLGVSIVSIRVITSLGQGSDPHSCTNMYWYQFYTSMWLGCDLLKHSPMPLPCWESGSNLATARHVLHHTTAHTWSGFSHSKGASY